MKVSITYFFLILTYCTAGQTLSKKELTNTDWCTNNFNQAFYKSDTIKLYRITDSLTDFQKLNIADRQIDYNGGKNITTIKLRENNTAEIYDHDIQSWTQTRRIGEWTWDYEDKNKKLTLLFNKKVLFSFLFIASSKDQLLWEYEEYYTKKPKKRYFSYTCFKICPVELTAGNKKVCRKAGGRNNNRQLYYYQLISGLTEFYLAFSC